MVITVCWDGGDATGGLQEFYKLLVYKTVPHNEGLSFPKCL